MCEKNIILFVDDKPSTHAYLRKYLNKEYRQWEIEIAFEIEEAIEMIEDMENKLFCVALDLYFPSDINKELLERLGVNLGGRLVVMNQGQLLGVYLHKKRIPYFYLSAHMSKREKNWPEDHPLDCLEKDIDEEEFAKVLEKLNSTSKAN
ncbi:MAG: hypothetical protein V3U87_02535 [Methylococcaceae bacterium]